MYILSHLAAARVKCLEMDIPAGSGAERRRAQLTVSDITAYATRTMGEEGGRENFVPPLKLGIRGISDRVVNASAPGNFGPRVSIFHLIIIVYYQGGRGEGQKFREDTTMIIIPVKLELFEFLEFLETELSLQNKYCISFLLTRI